MALPKELQLEWDISLKEKYLSLDKEKRIRRMQFFERMLIPGVLLALLFIFLPSLILWASQDPSMIKIIPYLSIIFYVLYTLVAIKYYPIVIKKRAHDFWKEWKIETYILLWTTIIINLYSIYATYLVSKMDLASIMWLMQYTSIINIIQWISALIWLYLLFRPWTKWTNEYGEQKYYKLKFLG